MTPTSLAARVDQVLPGVLTHLGDLIRLPTVSAEPDCREDLDRSASLISLLLKEAGLETVEVVRVAGGHPAVMGHRRSLGEVPTVLLYAHHDVQPAGDAAHWTSEPFSPVVREGRLYGLGSADDKGGLAVHLAALLALGDELPVNVTVLIDGEEEVGSPTLPALLDRYADELAADVVVVTDSVNWATDIPALTVSLRGLLEVVVEVQTLSHEVHSGLWGRPRRGDHPPEASRNAAHRHRLGGGAGTASDGRLLCRHQRGDRPPGGRHAAGECRRSVWDPSRTDSGANRR